MATKRSFTEGNSEDAKRVRANEAARDALIKELGWAPEEKTQGGRYCATAGEMRLMLREQQAAMSA